MDVNDFEELHYIAPTENLGSILAHRNYTRGPQGCRTAPLPCRTFRRDAATSGFPPRTEAAHCTRTPTCTSLPGIPCYTSAETGMAAYASFE